jgi:hypothetical protein
MSQAASSQGQASRRYDRQIRVWGREAQGRLLCSKALLCGLRSLNVEVRATLRSLLTNPFTTCIY